MILMDTIVDMIIVEIAIENNLYLLHDDADFLSIARINPNLKLY